MPIIQLLNNYTPILTDALGVPPGLNNGTDGALYHALRNPPPLPEAPDSVTYDSCDFPQTEEEYNRRANLNTTGCTCEYDAVSL